MTTFTDFYKQVICHHQPRPVPDALRSFTEQGGSATAGSVTTVQSEIRAIKGDEMTKDQNDRARAILHQALWH